MAAISYEVTLLTEVPEVLQRPRSMDSFHAFAPYATEGPLDIKVVYHLPACEAITEYIAVVKAAMQAEPGKYVDVVYSSPSHWQSRHPCLRHTDVVEHLLMH